MLNSMNFHFYINLIALAFTSYAKLKKNSKNGLNFCMSDDIKMYVYGQISRTSRSHMTSDLKIGVLFINCHLDEKKQQETITAFSDVIL